MKEVKNRFPGATVNDVLTAVLVMMVRRYLQDRNDPSVLDQNLGAASSLLRGNFPINMRSSTSTSSHSSGNNFSSGAFVFDFDYSSRAELVWKVKRQIDLIKLSPQVTKQQLCNDMEIYILIYLYLHISMLISIYCPILASDI